MARLAIHLLITLDMALMIWGQQTFPPIIPTFPPPPTMNLVINESVFVFIGEPVNVRDNERVTIDCSVTINEAIMSGIPNPTVNWLKDGNTLVNGSAPNVVISGDRRRLIITDTLLAVGGQLGNSGNYTCDVCTDFMDPNCNMTTEACICGEPNIEPPTGPATVTPAFIQLTCGQDVEVSTLQGVATLIFQCSIFNGTSPVPRIFKDGVQIRDSFPLLISPASDADFGTYTFGLLTACCGSTMAVSRIIRQADPPVIDKGPFIPPPSALPPGDMTTIINSPAYIVDGFDLTLVCNITSGTRPITIMWLRDERPYPAGGNNSIITVSDYTDGEVFTCRAENIVGFDMANTTVNVFEPPQILPIPFPTPPPGETTVSTGQPSNTTVETGTPVTIYCPSSGIDDPIIEWFRDGVMVLPGGRLSIFTPRLRGAIVTSALRIDDFQPDTDSGTYICRSTNIVGLANGGTTLMGDVCPSCPPPGFITPVPGACPICGIYQTGNFGPCSLACHRGMQTREVFCVNLDTGMRVDEVFCNQSARPPDTQRCGSGPCASRWRRGPWSKCSTTCQTGHQKREVVCTDNAGDPAPDNMCDPRQRPRSERFCNQDIKCFPCKDVSERFCHRLARTPMGCMSDNAREYCCWSCQND